MPISTPDICDQYGDRVQVAEPLFRHYGKVTAFGGEAATVRCFEDNSRVAEMVRTAGEGKVLVVDGGGSRRRSLLGDNLALAAVENGWSGILVFGCVRDVEELADMSLGVLALGAIPRKTEKRNQGEVGVPVSFAGVTIEPGSFVYADLSGVVVTTESWR